MKGPQIPVSLVVGPSRIAIGTLPAVDPDLFSEVLEDILIPLRQIVGRQAEIAESAAAATEILEQCAPELLAAISANQPGAEGEGPIVRVLRERQGMTRAALAKAMDRNRGSVARWEAGRATRFTIVDARRASRALGYPDSTVMRVTTAMVDRTEDGPFLSVI